MKLFAALLLLVCTNASAATYDCTASKIANASGNYNVVYDATVTLTFESGSASLCTIFPKTSTAGCWDQLHSTVGLVALDGTGNKSIGLAQLKVKDASLLPKEFELIFKPDLQDVRTDISWAAVTMTCSAQ